MTVLEVDWKMENLNYDFDPDFSEYNPIFAELKAIKEETTKKEDENFVVNLIKRLTCPVVIQLD